MIVEKLNKKKFILVLSLAVVCVAKTSDSERKFSEMALYS